MNIQFPRTRGSILSSEHVERRLAAILAADVAGSCRLIGIDEEGALAQLKALRKTLVDPKITDHRGRIVKNTGDGALVEFGSVVDAVRCAVEIQRGMAERNIDVPLGACPNSRCSNLRDSDSTFGYEQVFSSLEYRSNAAAAAERAGLRAERPCLAIYR